MTILETARLRLEPCAPEHLEGLHAMNRRPEVMRYIGAGEPETLEGTQRMVELVQRCWAHFGFSWWTFIDRASGRVAGAGAVQHLRPEPQRPADWAALRAWPLELGWRLHPDFWRLGLASEAAERMAGFAFEDLAAPELYAVRHPDNAASGRVMDRLGMQALGLQRWYGEMLAAHRVSRDAWQTRQEAREKARSAQ